MANFDTQTVIAIVSNGILSSDCSQEQYRRQYALFLNFSLYPVVRETLIPRDRALFIKNCGDFVEIECALHNRVPCGRDVASLWPVTISELPAGARRGSSSCQNVFERAYLYL